MGWASGGCCLPNSFVRLGDLVNFSSFGLSVVTAKANPLVVPNQHQLTEGKNHFVILNEEFDLYILYLCIIVLVQKSYQLFCENFLISFRKNINHVLL